MSSGESEATSDSRTRYALVNEFFAGISRGEFQFFYGRSGSRFQKRFWNFSRSIPIIFWNILRAFPAFFQQENPTHVTRFTRCVCATPAPILLPARAALSIHRACEERD